MTAHNPSHDKEVADIVNAIIEANRLKNQTDSDGKHISDSKVITTVTDAIVEANQMLHLNNSIGINNVTVQEMVEYCLNCTKICDNPHRKPMSEIGWVSLSSVPCLQGRRS